MARHHHVLTTELDLTVVTERSQSRSPAVSRPCINDGGGVNFLSARYSATMSSERTPLNPRYALPVGQARYSSSDRELLSSVDEDDLGFVRVHRRTVYCLLGYALLASILALACMLALLLGHTGSGDASGGERRPALDHTPPPPLPMPTDPSSPPLHNPLPARRSWNKSHLAHFLLLTDIHLEPHYNATAPNALDGMCRDEQRLDECRPADWESTAFHSRSTVYSSASSPYYYGRYMCDPPHSLVSSALHSLATTLANVPLDVILLPGDLAAHFIACPRTLYSAINRTLALVTSAFPSTPIIFSLGNTDTFPTSSLPLHSEPAAASAAVFASARNGCQTGFSTLLDLLLLNGVLDERSNDDSIHTFCHGGYYSKRISSGRIRILSLNTLAWSQQLFDSSQANRNRTSSDYPSNLKPDNGPVPCDERLDDPFGQFAWLETEVRYAADNGQHVWLVGHVPPGVKAGEQGWCWQYWQRLERLLSEYERVITQLHFGDYSQDMIRLVQRASSTHRPWLYQTHSQSSGGVSHVIHINPGLSPRKNVNPAARVYTYNRSSSHVIDYQQLYIDLTRTHTTRSHPSDSRTQPQPPPQPPPPHWLFQYNALDAYAMDEYSAAGWLDVLQRMRWTNDGVLMERYMRGVNVWKAGVGDGVDYLCDAMAMGLADNRRCKQTGVVPGLQEAEE